MDLTFWTACEDHLYLQFAANIILYQIHPLPLEVRLGARPFGLAEPEIERESLIESVVPSGGFH